MDKEKTQEEIDKESHERWVRQVQSDQRIKDALAKANSPKPFDPATATDFECEMYDRAHGIV